MAADYTVTGQTIESERAPDGTVTPVVKVAYTTHTEPPTKGHVTVPQALLADKDEYVSAVKAKIETAVAGHVAVAGL